MIACFWIQEWGGREKRKGEGRRKNGEGKKGWKKEKRGTRIKRDTGSEGGGAGAGKHQQVLFTQVYSNAKITQLQKL